MDIIKHATVKAVKNHKCDYCLQVIHKGITYEKSFIKCYGEIYTWKSHPYCSAIASELKMFDECDEGVTSEDFIETVKNEYMEIMIKTQADYYESNEFRYPPFADQLIFVCRYHSVMIH